MALRSWATPMVIGSFAIMAVTGILMFFHLDSGLNKTAHEWAGLVMVAATVAHVLMNWRAFAIYFKRPLAQVLIAGGVGVLGLSFMSFGNGAARPDLRALVGGMGAARIETLAQISGQTPDALIARLTTNGITGATAASTVNDLAGGAMERKGQILALAFASAAR